MSMMDTEENYLRAIYNTSCHVLFNTCFFTVKEIWIVATSASIFLFVHLIIYHEHSHHICDCVTTTKVRGRRRERERKKRFLLFFAFAQYTMSSRIRQSRRPRSIVKGLSWLVAKICRRQKCRQISVDIKRCGKDDHRQSRIRHRSRDKLKVEKDERKKEWGWKSLGRDGSCYLSSSSWPWCRTRVTPRDGIVAKVSRKKEPLRRRRSERTTAFTATASTTPTTPWSCRAKWRQLTSEWTLK